jgi:hypothetical protein
VATPDPTWAKWNADWWERQATRGGLVAGVVHAFAQMTLDSVLHGRSAALHWLRLCASILLGPEALDAEAPPGPAVVTGTVVHLSVSACVGMIFGAVVARCRALRRSSRTLVVAAALGAIVLGVVNVYSVAPVVGWTWVPERVDPFMLVVGHAAFFGVPLAIYLNRLAGPRRRLGLN